MKRRIEMKKLMAMILTFAMVMSLCVVPASAAGSGVTITITPDKSRVDTATGDAIVTYTVKAKVTDPNLKVGSLTITLDPSAGLTLAEKMKKDDSAFYYQTTSKQYKYDEETGTGIFDVKFNYAPKTKTFVAAGTTQDRNLNSTHGEIVLMTIMGKIAKGTTGSVTLKTTQHSYGEPSGSTASVDCDVTPATVTISKAPITSVTASVDTPVKGKPLDFAGTVDASAPYSITKVEWFESTNASGTPVTAPATAKAEQYYYARITLTAKSGETFDASLHKSISGDYSVYRNSDTELYLTKAYLKTDSATLKGIKIIDKIDGHAPTVAVPYAAPNTTETNTLTLVATSVYDAAPGGPVAATWEITNEPKPTGVSIDKTTGKLTVDNTAGDGTVRVLATFEGKTDAVTVAITKEDSKATHIVATPPATGTNITVPNGGSTPSGQCSYKVYDQYGAAMTGISATWKMEPETVPGVTFVPANGSFNVDNNATTGTVKLYAKIGALKSNEITFNIIREESKPFVVTITGADSVNVPIVHAPGADGWEHKTYTAEVKDQYGAVIPNPSVEWSVTDATGVSIDATTGKLTVSNKANAGAVTITAKSGDATGNKDVTINKPEAKATLVEICDQVGDGPETNLHIPAATFTNSEAYTAKVYDQYGVYMPTEMVHWALDHG